MTPRAPHLFIWLMAIRVTPPTETASANQEWVELAATGAWWDTGDFMSTAVVRVVVQETVIHLLGTACLGEWKDILHSNISGYSLQLVTILIYI